MHATHKAPRSERQSEAPWRRAGACLIILALLTPIAPSSHGEVLHQDLDPTPKVVTFSAQTLDGQRISDRSLLGKVVVLDFWATWCSPCVKSVPHLRSLAERHRDDPFVLVSISTDRGRRSLERFLVRHRMDWPQVHDPKRRLTAGTFGVRRYPTYLVVNHRGEIVYQVSGWSSRGDAELDRAVAAALVAARVADPMVTDPPQGETLEIPEVLTPEIAEPPDEETE